MALDEGRLGDALAQIDRYMQLIDVRQSPLAPDEGPNKAFRQALLLQARVYARGGRWNEVAERAEQCIAYDTEDAAAHRLRGEALYRSDPTDAANVNKAFDSFRQSYRLADKKRGASGVAVEFPPPEIQLCRLAVEFGHPEIAARYSDDLRRALPKYAQANPAERVRCGLFLAEHLLLQGDNSAGQEINAIGKLSADDLRRITAIMRYLARDPKATDDLTSLVDEFPDDERLSNYLARALADSKVLADRSRALRIATANQAAHPSSVSARCTLAWAHRYAGDPNAAFEAIRPTLQENDLAAASGTPRESPFLARLNSDDSYILAKLIYEHDPGQIGAVIALSQQSLSKIEPFRYRSLAEQWLR